ncbi:MAG: 3-dehydroquinate synthase [Myxococcota bacterium]
MSTLVVELGERAYPIHLVRELPGPLVAREVARIRKEGSGGRTGGVVFVVTDANVGPLYAEGVTEALEAEGLRPALRTIPAGEHSKSLDTISGLVDDALGAGVGRRDVVVALGGGVVGDIAGFLAAILHRGVAFVQVPTTLLAQVDSSVGGKTGVNHAAGKNLIGAFWQPRAVVTSHAVLGTLPERERRCGLAESLKHGFLADPDLVDRAVAEADALRRLDAAPTLAMVEACCRIKAAVVAEDERESGRRAILNLGHTFGHAYERLLGYGTLTHGEAVSLGMVWAARLSEAVAIAKPGLVDRIVDALEAVGLPADPGAAGLPGLGELLRAARTDKKADRDRVNFVTLADVGRPLIRTLTWQQIEDALGGER